MSQQQRAMTSTGEGNKAKAGNWRPDRDVDEKEDGYETNRTQPMATTRAMKRSQTAGASEFGSYNFPKSPGPDLYRPFVARPGPQKFAKDIRFKNFYEEESTPGPGSHNNQYCRELVGTQTMVRFGSEKRFKDKDVRLYLKKRHKFIAGMTTGLTDGPKDNLYSSVKIRSVFSKNSGAPKFPKQRRFFSTADKTPGPMYDFSAYSISSELSRGARARRIGSQKRFNNVKNPGLGPNFFPMGFTDFALKTKRGLSWGEAPPKQNWRRNRPATTNEGKRKVSSASKPDLAALIATDNLERREKGPGQRVHGGRFGKSGRFGQTVW